MRASELEQGTEELRELLRDYAPLASYDFTDEQVRLLVSHLMLVIEKNKVVNLTRILDPRDALVLHVMDSLLFIAPPEAQMSEKSMLLDMGTGGGYPGIPLAIATGATSLLVDSVGKKVTAVHEFVEQLGLNDTIVCQKARVEELPQICGDRFDFVVARAVAKTNILVEYAAPLLKKGGLLLVGKGKPDSIELDAAHRAAKMCGLSEVSRETFELPRDLGHREILVYRKDHKPSLPLPRPVGMAKRKPLGE